MPHPLSLYVHIPFCVRKCSYCDFNAYSGLGAISSSFVEAIISEIRAAAEPETPVSTIFFGGGTPTFLLGAELGAIVDACRVSYRVDEDAEITAEANPGTVDADKFGVMRKAGFNRLSIGVQAFDDRLLKGVDREHSAAEAIGAVRRARQAGFENLSIDLMFGLPGQSRDDWERSLDVAIDLQTEHLSLYGLTLEPGTRFERLSRGGKLHLPSDEDELWMYEEAIRRLEQAGLEHYEVSNFARPGIRSRHNQVYWRNEEYLGFGPGAVSFRHNRRWTNEKLPAKYIARVKEGDGCVIESDVIDPETGLLESLLTGLRLRDGISTLALKERYGIDPLVRYGDKLRRLRDRGWLEEGDKTLRLSHNGLLFSTSVFLELLD